MTKRRSRARFAVITGSALALAAVSGAIAPVRAADQQPMPRMTHAQRQAAAAARKDKIKPLVDAQQAAIKEVERQHGQQVDQPPAEPKTPSAGSGK